MNIHLCNFSPAFVGNEISDYIHRVSSHSAWKESFIHFLFFFSKGGEGREGKIPWLFYLKDYFSQCFHELTPLAILRGE